RGTRRHLVGQRIITVFSEFAQKRCPVTAAAMLWGDLELDEVPPGVHGVRADAAHPDHLRAATRNLDLEHQGTEPLPPPIGLQPLEAVAVPFDVRRGGRAEPPGRLVHRAAASAKVDVSMTARKCTSPATTRS